MSRFTHLILTGFNVRIQDAPGLDPEWLRHRFDLFERFCFPSVRGQTNQNFTWIALLDPDTPEAFKRRIEEYRAYDRFRPVYIPGLMDYREPVLEHVARDSTHLITTTLDNDDAIAARFVDRVQAEFREQEFELVNLVSGYRLDLGKRRLYRHRVRTNPFISLFERSGDPTTIRGCGAHDLLSSTYDRIRDVESEPLWLQVVHDRNIAATGVWGCRRVALDELEGSFTLDHGIRGGGQSSASIALENVRRRIERFLINCLGEGRTARVRKGLRAVAVRLGQRGGRQ